MKTYHGLCRICSTPFKSNRSDKLYCGSKCHNRAYTIRRAERKNKEVEEIQAPTPTIGERLQKAERIGFWQPFENNKRHGRTGVHKSSGGYRTDGNYIYGFEGW